MHHASDPAIQLLFVVTTDRSPEERRILTPKMQMKLRLVQN